MFFHFCLNKSFCQLCLFNDPVLNGEIVQDIVNWIQCDSCRNWFHTICVGVKDNALPT